MRLEHCVDYIVDGGRNTGRPSRPYNGPVQGFQLQRTARHNVGVHGGVHLLQRTFNIF
jgi:hypothetical protein